jgi:hypothetical protein
VTPWQSTLAREIGPDDGLVVFNAAIPARTRWPYRVVIDPGLTNAELVYLTGEGADQRSYSVDRGVLGGATFAHAAGAVVRWVSPLSSDAAPTGGEHPDLISHVAIGLAAQTSVDTGLAAKASASHDHDAAYATLAHSHGAHGHGEAEITGLVSDLTGKSPTGHTHAYAAPSHSHAESDVTGLQTDLGAKAAASHNHDASYAATSHAHVDADLPPGIARDSEVSQAIVDHLAAAQHGSTGSGIPLGVIVMWGGLLSAIPTGWALCDGQNGTPDLRDRFVKGAAAAANPGATAGAATHAHAAHTLTQPGSATTGIALSAHAGAAVADHTVTQPGAHTNHVVTQPGAHSNHAVTQPSAHADVPTHTHPMSVQGGTTAATTGTHVMTSTAVGGSARAITAGDAINAPTGAVASQPHTGAAVDAHSAHTGAAVDAHSAHSGAAVSAHGVTQSGAHSVTDTGHSHTGAAVSAHDAVNSEPAYYALAFIQKIA